ncbi:MAG TPA: ATP synthase F0 subunit C [Candidatus Acidoferrales bacterium]|jgi:F-type H+-transporting ATPase subunit c|nr:ATP synthase F0 subunit C [Candidatus Acidoferrales bacterium]
MKKTMFVLLALVAICMFATPVFAQDAGTAAAKPVNWVAIASGFPMAIAVGLAALGQGRVAGSACEGLARNPAARAGIQLAMILGLAFIESLVLFTLVVIFAKVS